MGRTVPRRANDDRDLIHGSFRFWAESRPNSPAVLVGDRVLTYQELDRWSDGLAAELRHHGVGRGALVPVVVPRSLELVAVLLALLKIGAAYAVLDPAWPAARLRAVVGSLAPGGLSVLAAGVEPHPFARSWIVPEVPAEIPPAPPAPRVVLSGADPAMVFFTSGTTGEPKAVPSPHRGTTRLTAGCPFAELGPGSVMPQISAASWDAFALEVWGPLTTGGTCVIPAESLLTPHGLRTLIREQGVNTLFLTTSLFHLLAEEDVTAFTGVATVMVGGERLHPGAAARFTTSHPGVRLVNGYGPVESTIFALWHEVRDPAPGEEVPLGRPCPRTVVLVLDGDRECAPGETGELCIAGDGLSSGYLHDPALTAERFVLREVAGRPMRVYRTGDRGSVDAAGVFHYGGRGDRQVKVRGHRFEPAGLERAAEAVEGVHRAVVLPLTGRGGGVDSLALFYRRVPRGPAPDELASALRAVVPAYSLPHAVVELDRFPLTANGKLDTRRLAALARQQLSTGRSPASGGCQGAAAVQSPPAGAGRQESAMSPAEATITRLMGEVLGRVPPSPRDEFFALSGTSLDAIRLCSRLSTVLGRAVSTSQLMRTPSASSLARWLDQPPPVVPRSGPVDALRLTAAQTAFLLANLDPATDAANHCLLAWELIGPAATAALAAAVEDVHHRHAYLSSAYDLVDGTARPGAATVDFRVVAADLLIETLLEPFDLQTGPVWRAAYTRHPRGGILALAVHHIALDAASQPVLAHDLALAYTARRRGQAPAFPSPARPEAALALIAQAQAGADLTAQRAYWVATLSGMPDLDLGAGSPGSVGDEDATRAPALRVPLTQRTLTALDRTARRHGCGRVAVLLHQVAEVLGELTGQRDFGIGVPVSRRLGQEAEAVVGCLIDQVCVRVQPGHAAGISRTADAVAGAIAHGELPFADVVRACGRRTAGRPPLYQVIVAVQEAGEPVLTLPDVQTRTAVLPIGTPPPTGLSVELFDMPLPELRVGADPRLVRPALAEAVAAGVATRLSGLDVGSTGRPQA